MKSAIKVILTIIALCIMFSSYLYFVGVPNWAVGIYQEYKAEGYVKAHLNDPNGALFRNKKGPCGEVNAKNKYGGYEGFIKYVANSEKAVTFESSPIFEKIWNFSCLMTEQERAAEIEKLRN
ncbi:hypothetical protein [Rheinheimera sp.]|uniref:hypothetical protein n=1 Tax=Rheinheimera sp. TaxID=1869214 RepID=UPI002735ED8B|nr:hypothetical protein [Rheinheimera sp.]MDP2715543.1 hypothetical protein [Rheinheimera sp.]